MWTTEEAQKRETEEETLREHLRGTLMEDTEARKKIVKKLDKKVKITSRNVHLTYT